MSRKRSSVLHSGSTGAPNKNGWLGVLTSAPVNRGYEHLLVRGVVLLAAGTVAAVGFAACASVLGRKRLAPPKPGRALRYARREMRRLAAPRP